MLIPPSTNRSGWLNHRRTAPTAVKIAVAPTASALAASASITVAHKTSVEYCFASDEYRTSGSARAIHPRAISAMACDESLRTAIKNIGRTMTDARNGTSRSASSPWPKIVVDVFCNSRNPTGAA